MLYTLNGNICAKKVYSISMTEKTALDKYLFKPFPGSSHFWASDHLEAIKNNFTLLDIGCGSGCMGEKARSLNWQKLDAIEIDESARDKAAKIYDNVFASILDVKDDTYDCILLLDILEHLTNPEELLKVVTKKLTKNGILLISVPNIAHWSIRLLLLFGFFNYTERGILDKTHFRFFTVSTAKKTVELIDNLKIVEVTASTPPVQFVLPDWICDNKIFNTLSFFHTNLAKLVPGFFGYQILLKVKKV